MSDYRKILDAALAPQLHSAGYGAGYSAFVQGHMETPDDDAGANYIADWNAGVRAALRHYEETDPTNRKCKRARAKARRRARLRARKHLPPVGVYSYADEAPGIDLLGHQREFMERVQLSAGYTHRAETGSMSMVNAVQLIAGLGHDD